MTEKVSVDTFPCPSVTEQDTVVEPIWNWEFEPGVHVGEPLIVCSITVTSKLAVPTPPSESVAVHVTVVVPTGNEEPDATSHVGPLDKSLSVAVTSKVTTSEDIPVMLAVGCG